MNIFKIEYYWYEDEHEETLLGKNVEREEFEKDLIKAKKFAESLKGKKIKSGKYLGKGYSIECLPEFYEQIIWFFTKKLGYIKCECNLKISYVIDDYSDKKILIDKVENKKIRSELK
jgi:hypothetical protein